MTTQEDSIICIIIILYLLHQFAHLSERSSSFASQTLKRRYSVLHTSTPGQGSRLVTCWCSYYKKTLQQKINRSPFHFILFNVTYLNFRLHLESVRNQHWLTNKFIEVKKEVRNQDSLNPYQEIIEPGLILLSAAQGFFTL